MLYVAVLLAARVMVMAPWVRARLSHGLSAAIETLRGALEATLQAVVRPLPSAWSSVTLVIQTRSLVIGLHMWLLYEHTLLDSHPHQKPKSQNGRRQLRQAQHRNRRLLFQR